VKQVLAALLARIGAAANRMLAAQLDQVTGRLDRMASPLDEMTGRLDRMASPLDEVAGRLDRDGARLDIMATRLEGVEASLVALHRAVEELGAIPALSTELVDGIAEAEARAAARLADVERLLAGR